MLMEERARECFAEVLNAFSLEGGLATGLFNLTKRVAPPNLLPEASTLDLICQSTFALYTFGASIKRIILKLYDRNMSQVDISRIKEEQGRPTPYNFEIVPHHHGHKSLHHFSPQTTTQTLRLARCSI